MLIHIRLYPFQLPQLRARPRQKMDEIRKKTFNSDNTYFLVLRFPFSPMPIPNLAIGCDSPSDPLFSLRVTSALGLSRESWLLKAVAEGSLSEGKRRT